MPTKRNVLAQLKRDELLEALDWYELEVDDRRVRDQLVDALAKSNKARLAEILPDLKRARLKEICGALDLDTSGREKSLLVERLTGAQKPPTNGAGRGASKASKAAASIPKPAKATARKKTAPKRAPVVSSKVLTQKQLERHLFAAADILRRKMDASEFKEYIFGVLFLKRCSDVFEERFDTPS